MIDTTHKLPVKRQAELLDLSRSNVYYLPCPVSPRPVSDADLVLMRRIDELHLHFPFAGARMLHSTSDASRLSVPGGHHSLSRCCGGGRGDPVKPGQVKI